MATTNYLTVKTHLSEFKTDKDALSEVSDIKIPKTVFLLF